MSQTHLDSDPRSPANPPGIPRWVKVFGIIVLVVILLFAIVTLNGGHSPNLHTAPTTHHSQQP